MKTWPDLKLVSVVEYYVPVYRFVHFLFCIVMCYSHIAETTHCNENVNNNNDNNNNNDDGNSNDTNNDNDDDEKFNLWSVIRHQHYLQSAAHCRI